MDVRISALPTAQSPISGAELVPIVQNGLTVQTTVSAITQSPNQTQPFLTVGQQPTLPNSRYFSAINGLQITDGGAQGAYTLQIVNNPTIPGTAGIAIPSGTTAQRNTTPAAMRLNVETKAFEGFDGTSWVSFITNISSPLVSFSAGTTGFTPNVPTGNNVVLGGTLNASNGGTGVTTLTGLAYGNGTSPFTAATGAQIASAIGSTAVANATNATNLLGGANGSLPYQTGSGATTFLAAGTDGYVLTLASGVPTWAASTVGVASFSAGTTGFTPSTGTTGVVTLAGILNVANGGTGINTLAAGYIPYGAGTSAFASNANFTYNTTNSTLGTPTLSVTSVTSVTPALSFNATNTSIASGATVAGSYLQSLFQNKSASAGASVNYVLSNNLGTDSTYYGEFGMNSSVFSASTPADFFSINNGIYFSGHDGDLSIGSGNGFKTYFGWGTAGQSAHVINASGAIGLSTNLGTTPALSGTTGYGTAGQVMLSAGSSSAAVWGNVAGGAF